MSLFLTRLVFFLAVLALSGETVLTAQTLSVLYSFGHAQNDGVDPMAGVVFGMGGKIFGTASVGGIGNNGLVYQLSPPAGAGAQWTEDIIYRFSGPDGSVPECPLTVAPDGTMFGTTLLGGAHTSGVVFQLSPPAVAGDPWSEKVLYSFAGFAGDGINPNHGLLHTPAGLVGVTFAGGANNRGTVFLLSPPAQPGMPWTERILYSFQGGSDGAFPSSELTMDSEGSLYGTTTLGGASNFGVVFQLMPQDVAPSSFTESVLHAFNDTDGSSPAGRLQVGPDGSLYGTASGGGALAGGTVFQLSPPGAGGGPWVHSILYNFSGGMDGGSPEGGVSLGQGGKLFGTTKAGGAFAGGSIFELDPPSAPGAGWTHQLLHSLKKVEGFLPQSRLLLSSGGLLGTTSEGGTRGVGTVFLLTL
jgi:uncharacterized repeat protein (TIGR03803 family)